MSGFVTIHFDTLMKVQEDLSKITNGTITIEGESVPGLDFNLKEIFDEDNEGVRDIHLDWNITEMTEDLLYSQLYFKNADLVSI